MSTGPEAPVEISGDVAVIGMSCRFPGASGYEAFWELLSQGRCEIREIPPERWDWRQHWGDPQAERNKTNSRWGSFIEGVDLFDAAFFSLSPRDAEILDPQQRIMLELAWSCFEDAGIRPSAAWGSRTGVFMGSAILDYKELLEEQGTIEAQYAAGIAHSVIASRISHWFNLRGPSVPMDTACASSLYAIHLAIRSLQRGECSMALAGGINILLTPRRYISFAKMGILSPTGRCRSFDDAADGTVRGEGAGLLLLKPLAEALRDGDAIHGVIKGSALNHSGKTHTLSYPNPSAQAEVIREAWQDARVAPETVSSIEAHGTGTPKGDPLEFEGLRQAFAAGRREGADEARCAIGSVKTNLGHLESAAGIAGVIKVLLSMQRRQLPALQGFRRLNHRISLKGTPFFMVDRLQEWRGPAPLRAGVSSFGFAGTNAHVVLEEAPAQARPALANEGAPCFLFGLSAKSPEALRRAAGDLLAWAERPESRGRLCELSAALLGARERLDVRAAFVAKDWEELRAHLGAVQAGEERPGLCRGAARKERGAAAPAAPPSLMDELRAARGQGEGPYRAKLGEAAELYARGADLDLGALAGGRAPRDLRLPPYPFSRERFWVPAGEPRREGAGAWLHPLVQANTSDLAAQRFSSTFSGAEPFLADHRVQGERVLPGAALLEMARVAAALSLPGARDASIRLRGVVFARPLAVGGAARRLEIAVTPEGEGEVAFEIAGDAPEGGDAPIHCQGKAAAAPARDAQAVDLAAAESRCAARALDGAACYAELGRIGFEYGPSHRGLESLALGQSEALGRLASASAPSAGAPALSVGTLDSALQAALLLMASLEPPEAGRPPMPFAVEEAELAAAAAAPRWVRVSARPAGADGTRTFDLDLCAESGEVCGRVRGLAVRAPAKAARYLAAQAWEPLPPRAQAAGFAAAERLVLLCEPGPGVAERVRADLGGARCAELRGAKGGAAERVARATWAALEEVRALLESKPRRALVQAVFAGAGEQRLYAALGGLLRSAGRENPALFGQVVELEALSDGARVASALAECARDPLAREVRCREGAWAAARWREVDAHAEPASPWKDGGVYLISGGAGGLGLIVAEAIAREAKGAVIHLVGRSPLSPESAPRLLALQALGCRAAYSQVDVASRAAVDVLVAGVVRDHGRLDGVIHSAAVLRDSFILRKERRELEEVFAGKALGAANLDEATKDLPLDCFILFSSVAGVLGNAGQADYAAANAFLDALASLRAELAAEGKRSGRTLSIDWPLWRDGGMRVGAEAERALRESFGMRAIEARAGLSALRRALATGAERVLYFEGELPALQRALEGPGVPAEPSASDLLGEVQGAPAKGDVDAAVELVKREMAQVLKVLPARMDEAAPMETHGIDSIATVQLTRQLERTFGPLPKTLFFEYRSIRELAGYFLAAHGEKTRSAAPASAAGREVRETAIPERPEAKAVPRRFARAPQAAPAERAEPGPVDIAIVGLAGRYPGARDVRAFWANLRDGVDSVTEIPPGRWDHGLYFDADKGRRGKTYSKWGGFIDGVDEFDPLFFNVSPREAEIMDPQERLFLQCAYEAVEDAGYTRESLARSPSSGARASVGVYVGVMWEEYALYGAQEQARGRNLALSASPASIANRVSYFFDFCGPSMAVDTLCSSSLTAIHLACQSLQRGECEAAIAGGVNVSIHPNKYLWLAQGRYVSSKGRCESFGEGGDGYVPGEGVGAVLLKPLARAAADGDSIYGVIRGSALNHGGKTNGFTVPSPVAQANVIGLALTRAGVDPRAVSYIEAHGTGTSLGDPIEIAGLAKAFEAKGASEPGFCAIGSAKSNIGHCEGAAGIAGLTKVLLQMKHRQLAPSLHSRSLNPNISFDRTPFRVQQTLAAWERPVVSAGGEKKEYPRIAGISSFGAGGSNAHLVVQEHVSAAPSSSAEAAPRPAVVLLSARDESRLQESARRLLDSLKGPELAKTELEDIAYTTQVGREAMEERLGLVARSASELAQKLEQFLGGEREAEGVFRGRASAHEKTVARLGDDEDMARTLEAWVEKAKLGKLLPLWVEGLSFDWSKLHRARRPRRVSLPTYPFARERCWVPADDGGGAAAPLLYRPALHPLLHENSSDLSVQRYTSTFTGRELFLRDHVVGGRRVLPGAAQLELARAAVAAAAGEASAGVRLRKVVWTTALAVEGEAVPVSIELCPEESGEIAFEIFSSAESREERKVFCRGAAALGLLAEGQRLDLAALKKRCGLSALSGADCYTAFQALGVTFGPGHRAIERLFVGEREVLAKLAVPAAAQEAGRGCLLNPGALDGALQSAMGLLVAEAASGARPGPAKALPFSLEELEVHAASSASMWAHARARVEAERDSALTFDVDLCDEAGLLCARARGLELRPVNEGQSEAMKAEMLARVWDAATPPRAEVGSAPERVSLIAGAGGTQTLALREAHPGGAFLEIVSGETVESLAAKIGALGDGDGLVWVAPEVNAALSPEASLAAQELGALHLFRLIKAVLSRGGGAKALSWTVVTSRCVAVSAKDAVEPTHAGAHGLAGAMAREYPNWRVRLVDAVGALSAEDLARAPVDSTGSVWAIREGAWYRQRLLPVVGAAAGSFRRQLGGVYVVIGGAGGVGEVWTEHAIRSHGAQVIWIGRRSLDASIRAKIDRLGALGPAPRYVQADATSLESLREAHRQIKVSHPAIHGVVHSAIALRDQGLAKMDEATFREAYAAKVDVSLRMAEVFGQEPLGFALFFSSTLALQPSAGQANYAAGCAFEDAFARHLGQVWPCPVKVINWGFWGEHGVVAQEAYRRRMEQAGIGSIEPREAMEALDALLSSPLAQAVFIKAAPKGRLEATASDEGLSVYPETLPALLPGLRLAEPTGAREVAAENLAFESEAEGLLCDLLALQLERAGVDWRAGMSPRSRRSDFYGRWLEESLGILAAHGASPSSDAWAAWEAEGRRWKESPLRRAWSELASAALRALPDVLNGKRRATEVLFPSAGFERVEGIYRGNPIADFFNDQVAEAVAAYLEERLRRDAAARVRVLEVGAGTGATSAAILRRLEPLARHLDEYCFSDISNAFVLRGEQELARGRPSVTGRRFDVDLPIAGQGVAPGAFDLAVATNVLHATQDVRRALRNVKAALKRNGVLVLNEISRKSLFAHLTFGLLEGWWSHRDSALRIPGCPALSPEGWRRALEAEGFGAVRFPAVEAHGAGQQIVLAQSDGLARQSSSALAAGALDSAPSAKAPKEARAASAARGNGASVPAASAADDLRERGRRLLRGKVSEVLKIPAERIKDSEPLGRYGVDSIQGVQLTNALRGALGELSSTFFFEHPTIDAMVEEIVRTRREALEALADSKPADSPSEAPSRVSAARVLRPLARRGEVAGPKPLDAPRSAEAREPGLVAVVGLAGRYPKASDVREYWTNLKSGRHCVSEVPKDRWDWREYFDEEKGRWGSIYSKWGGFLDDVARFDPAFFHISPREAAQMDPQERLFLETAYASIEDAGYTPAALCPSRRVGVFAGAMNADYGRGAAHWSIANRVSFAFDFQGPSLAVDTACSSSLTAIHLALESLRSGTCECAIAGGVNLIVDPLHFAKLSAASMLSSGDRCRAFGDGADGIVVGEAVGAVVLKPLAQALEDGDHVWAVVRGSMINAGGRTHGYTVPNPKAQQAVIAQALRRARVDPRAISYLEAHGTGTELGDPIEIAALQKAFEEWTGDKQFCAIGSAKSNLGHCESAAGIAGVTKVLLQMQHGQLAPSLHAQALNPRIAFEQTPFVVQQSLAEWKRPILSVGGELKEQPRIAGISSFGAGGANAHLLLEEHRPEESGRAAASARADGPALVVLSARTERDLREKARQLAQAIETGALRDEQLASAACTLQVGREAMEERLGLIVGSVGELRQKLEAHASGQRCPAGCRRGRAPDGAGVPSAPSPADQPGGAGAARGRGDLEAELERWIRGEAVDWSRVWAQPSPRRVSLPSYPFGGDRHWMPEERRRLRPRSAAAPEPAPAASPAPPRSEAPGPTAPPLELAASAAKPPAPAARPPEPAGPVAMPPQAERPRVVLRPLAPSDPSAAPEAKRGGPAAPKVPLPAPRAEVRSPEPAAPRRASKSAAALAEELVASLAKALYVQPGDVAVDKQFVDMGLDSIVGVEWIKAINKQYGLSLKATIVYDHPTARALAAFLEKELARKEGAPARGEGGARRTESSGSRAVDPPVREVPLPALGAAPLGSIRSDGPELSLQEVLRRVQQGSLSPEEADVLCQQLESEQGARAVRGATGVQP